MKQMKQLRFPLYNSLSIVFVVLCYALLSLSTLKKIIILIDELQEIGNNLFLVMLFSFRQYFPMSLKIHKY